MRTTLTLDDDLAHELAKLARESGMRFKVVVNEALRRGLGDRMAAEPDFSVVAHPGHLRPGIDDRRLNELAWEPEKDGL